MQTPTILEILEQIGAFLRDDHFVYSSGKHGAIYINKNDLFAHTRATEQAAKFLAEKYRELEVDCVAGPAMCGVIPAHWVAYHLSGLQSKEIFGVFAEPDASKNFVFERGFDKFVRGKSVLIVDDIATSGNTLKKFIQTIRTTGGNVIAASVLVNRNPQSVTAEALGVPFHALASLEIPTFTESECPLCKDAKPINTTVGHGKEYLRKKELVKQAPCD